MRAGWRLVPASRTAGSISPGAEIPLFVRPRTARHSTPKALVAPGLRAVAELVRITSSEGLSGTRSQRAPGAGQTECLPGAPEPNVTVVIRNCGQDERR